MDTTDSAMAAVVVVTLNGATVSVAVDAAKGSVVVTLTTEDGEQVTLDSERVERLREALERLNGENIELTAKCDRMDSEWQNISRRDWKLFGADRQKWADERAKLHKQRMELAGKYCEMSTRAYAAERRVQELKDKVEALEQALDYGQPNPYSV